ncbi:metal-sensitive transcriptional regulator [Alkalilimnicola ehrlichii]|uniref:metal-sensitive transcriptional regulator n=1 Tax=Alkalilimnicola ehrlichii TaxID=351052 RepID=UPI001C6E4342
MLPVNCGASVSYSVKGLLYCVQWRECYGCNAESSRNSKKALLARLARIEGQIRGIRRMIDEDESCEAVAQQLAASRKALNKAFLK